MHELLDRAVRARASTSPRIFARSSRCLPTSCRAAENARRGRRRFRAASARAHRAALAAGGGGDDDGFADHGDDELCTPMNMTATVGLADARAAARAPTRFVELCAPRPVFRGEGRVRKAARAASLCLAVAARAGVFYYLFAAQDARPTTAARPRARRWTHAPSRRAGALRASRARRRRGHSTSALPARASARSTVRKYPADVVGRVEKSNASGKRRRVRGLCTRRREARLLNHEGARRARHAARGRLGAAPIGIRSAWNSRIPARNFRGGGGGSSTPTLTAPVHAQAAGRLDGRDHRVGRRRSSSRTPLPQPGCRLSQHAVVALGVLRVRVRDPRVELALGRPPSMRHSPTMSTSSPARARARAVSPGASASARGRGRRLRRDEQLVEHEPRLAVRRDAQLDHDALLPPPVEVRHVPPAAARSTVSSRAAAAAAAAAALRGQRGPCAACARGAGCRRPPPGRAAP